MSNPLAHYAFLPWLRRGIGSMISEKDALGTDPSGLMAKERADIQVGMSIDTKLVADGSTNTEAVSKTFEFLGPPDVLGISERGIVRVEPKNDVQNYEANGLPYIEFFEEDFAWAYTPAAADTVSDTGKLTPWLALICLKEDEFDIMKTGDGKSFMRISDTVMDEVFHDNTQHWAWAHVHMNTDLVASAISGQISEVSGEISTDPDSGLCRLLCPRKLNIDTNYTAVLIPAFETGRLAGLGLDYTDVYAQKMSWAIGEDYAAKERGYEYPVYYSWRFRTDAFGDFESLARKLEAIVAPPELGRREMYIDAPGLGLDGMSDSVTLGLEGALKPTSFTPAAWPDGIGDTAYRKQVRQLLNLSLDHENQNVSPDTLGAHPFTWSGLGDDPVVTPHVYGRWHGSVNRLENGLNAPWVNQLNLDPRNRAAAGLGLEIIQEKQEGYMREAWEQVEAINEANEKIRKAALASLVNHALYHKHIGRARQDQKIRMTQAAHKFMLKDGKTVHTNFAESIVPNASQAAGFKKITRPGKKLNRKFNKLAGISNAYLHETVTQKFDQNLIKTAPDKDPVASAIFASVVTTAIATALTQYNNNDTATATQVVFEVVQEESPNAAVFNQMQQSARKTFLKNKIDNEPGLSAGAKVKAKVLIDGITQATHGGANSNHQVRIATPAFQAHFGLDHTAKVYQQVMLDMDTNGAPGSIGTVTTTVDIEAFGTAFDDFNAFAQTNIIAIGPQTPLGLSTIDDLQVDIESGLNQKAQMLTRLGKSISISKFDQNTQTYTTTPIPALRPVMAHPEFDEPMFRELKGISKDYILPNLNLVPNNSITLLETNQRFIEAYMAGLNHEMARELLWREFPTDQRGTYFRQFWDVSDDIFTSDPEKKLDIEKMHSWNGNLGSHSPRAISNSSGTYLVLLVRGELLRKYPNTQVYAQKAVFKNASAPAAPRDLSDPSNVANIKVPLFMAELEPDVYLFGFDLDKAEAKGDATDASKPGWYFALRERPGQIRFGLDDWGLGGMPIGSPSDWNDLSWEHLVITPSALDTYQLDANFAFQSNAGSSNSPLATWGKNAADMAYILYQNPVLYARHAQEMLPV